MEGIDVWCGEPTPDGVTIGVLWGNNPYTTNLCRNIEMTLLAESNSLTVYNQRISGYVWNFGSWKPYQTGYLSHGVGLLTDAYAKLYLTNNAQSMQVVSVLPVNACSCIDEEVFPPGAPGKTYTAVNCGKSAAPSAIAYPNPASTLLTVEVLDDYDSLDLSSEASRSSAALSFEIRLYDNKGYLVRQINTKDRVTQINTSDLPNGNYFLHIYEDGNDKPDIHQIIIAH